MKWWLLLAAFVLTTAASDGRTLFVDPSGRMGSKTIDDSLANAVNGDQIVVMPGSYFGGTIGRSISISGTGDVTIKGKGTSALIINAPGCKISNLTLEGSGTNPGLMIKSPDNILVGCTIKGDSKGLEIMGSNNTFSYGHIAAALGVSLFGAKNTMRNITFEGEKGVQIRGSSENVIKGCNFLTTQGIEISSGNNNIIQGNSLTGTTFGITLSGSGYNSLTENQFAGSYVSGLDLLDSASNNLKGNVLNGCKVGISLRQSDRNRLANNRCLSNERAGVYLNGSRSNELVGNILSKNGNGILLTASEMNTLVSNVAYDNTYGISLRGAKNNALKDNSMKANNYNLRIDSGSRLVPVHDDFIQDLDASNFADEKPVCYLVGVSNKTVTEDCGFIGLVECNNVMVSNQTISNSSAGVLMVGSADCSAENCTIHRSETGFWMIDSKNCTARKCLSESCKMGFLAFKSPINLFEDDISLNSSESGFKADGSLNLTIKGS